MKNRLLISIPLLFLALSLSYTSIGQVGHDTTLTKYRKNIVRLNLTRTLVFGFKNYSIGYERVFKNFNSTSINLGYLTLPEVFSLGLSKYGVHRENSQFGFSVAADYRRYFKKRNRGFAPDGLYYGVYFTNFNYKTNNKLTFQESYSSGSVDAFANLKTEINVFQAGLQLGYQFIIWKRLAIDLVMMAPGLGHYKLGIDLEGNIDAHLEDEVYKDMLESAINKYPVIGDLLKDRTVNRSGNFSSWAPGYRLVAHIGFLF